MARGRLPSSRKSTKALLTWDGLSAEEKTFVREYLDTANARLAYDTAWPEAGAANAIYNIERLLHTPRIENNIFRELTNRMYRGAIVGTKVLMELCLDKRVNSQVRCSAAAHLRAPLTQLIRNKEKVSNADLSLSEQSIDQLRELVDRLESERGDKAKTVGNGANSCATSSQGTDLLNELEPE